MDGQHGGNITRRDNAKDVRNRAAEIAYSRYHPTHCSNQEEYLYTDLYSFMSFTKGLAHSPKHGLLKDKKILRCYRSAINSGHVDEFDKIKIGNRQAAPTNTLIWHFYSSTAAPLFIYEPGTPALTDKEQEKQHRRWESPTTGFVFSLEGPDCQAVTMPPAPKLIDNPSLKTPSDELIAEMAEVYWLSLLRDVPLESFDTIGGGSGSSKVDKAIKHLKALQYYKEGGKNPGCSDSRERPTKLTKGNVFRGQGEGVQVGPYLSQFMLVGSKHLGNGQLVDTGLLQYGSINVNLKVRVAPKEVDYMTHWHEWLDVQNGADVRDTQLYQGQDFRHIATLRDMATYVHHDQLYEAYFNALLWLLNVGAPVDPHFQSTLNKTTSTEGFALWGGPHILSLMTEVATRALKAVRFQKFNTHLRARPEALAGLIAAQSQGTLPTDVSPFVKPFYDAINQEIGGTNLLDEISRHNNSQNERHVDYLDRQAEDIAKAKNLPLLPMAFPEGSPMHPCYGAGHATVAGACVTILKAFFNEDSVLYSDEHDNLKANNLDYDPTKHTPFAYIPKADGSKLIDCGKKLKGIPLTVGGELNKLAANISIARNVAGVHYYSDYIDSLRMGEQVAIGILEEQSICYPKDPFVLSFKTFDGDIRVIGQGYSSATPTS